MEKLIRIQDLKDQEYLSELNIEERQYFLALEEMEEFKKIKVYTDKWPLLGLRKKVWQLKAGLVRIC